MTTERTNDLSNGEDFPVDDPVVAFYTEYTGPRIPPQHRAILRELGRYADPSTGVAGPSQLVIADRLDMHRTTVANGLKELTFLGFLTSRAKVGTGGKQTEYIFTAANAGWHPAPKDDLEKSPLLAAYRRVVSELRKEVEDNREVVAHLQSRLALWERGSSPVPETKASAAADVGIVGEGAELKEREGFNVGVATDIALPVKSLVPPPVGNEPNVESLRLGNDEDNSEGDQNSGQSEQQSPVSRSNSRSDKQVGTPQLGGEINQLPFTSIANTTAPSQDSVSPEAEIQVSGRMLSLSSHEAGAGTEVGPDTSRAPLPVPVDLVAEPAIDGSITLSWHVEVDDRVTGYRIVRKCLRGADTGRVIWDVEGQLEAQFVDSDVVPGAKYIYMVRSQGAGEVSDLSRHLTVTGVG